MTDSHSNLTNLFSIQLAKCTTTQRDAVVKSSHILNFLKSQDLKHPYFILTASQYAQLMEIPDYRNPCGPKSDLTEFTSLFRIACVRSLQRCLTGIIDPTLAVTDSDSFVTHLKTLYHQHCSREGVVWAPLSLIANGFYQNPRCQLWWSPDSPDSDICIENSRNFAVKCGICDDWISDTPILLKVALANLSDSSCFVPTFHEAFDLPVFDPQPISQSPKYGHAIDLSQSPLANGNREVVSSKIEASSIVFSIPTGPSPFCDESNCKSFDEVFSDLMHYYSANTI